MKTVQRFETSDGKLHESEKDAYAHETFLLLFNLVQKTVRLHPFGSHREVALAIERNPEKYLETIKAYIERRK